MLCVKSFYKSRESVFLDGRTFDLIEWDLELRGSYTIEKLFG